MQNERVRPSRYELDRHGLRKVGAIHWNLNPAQLIEQAIVRGEGMLSDNGALVVRTGQFTGRSPKDKFIVRAASTESTVNWGPVNQPMSPENFDRLFARLVQFWEGKEVFVQDCFAGADPAYQLPVRVIAQRAWHALFGRQLFVRGDASKLAEYTPEFTIFFAPAFQADPAAEGTRSQTAIVLNFTKKIILIAGTEYAGELKKSVFSTLNYLLTFRNVLPMHCSANVGQNGKTALFFGLSGTGKTTLSADPGRRLIGDDEHGWSDRGVFNFEGGCYAKCIHLSKEKEPQIWNAIRFGAVLENVAMDPETRLFDFDSDQYTENTRAAYQVEFIDNAVIPGIGGHPSHVLFLTPDAFGVLPPISRLTPDQAMYHFLSGYTAKLAGTEAGLGSEPVPEFSTCFASPFLPLPPKVYAAMLGDRLKEHNAQCWLVNTGWTGGAFGTGKRMSLKHTRSIVHAVLDGSLAGAEYVTEDAFGLSIPVSCKDVPSEILNPRNVWADKHAYE